MLQHIHHTTDFRDIKQLTANLLHADLTTSSTPSPLPNIPSPSSMPLDQIEQYIRTVTSSLGGELVKYDHRMALLLGTMSELHSDRKQTFTLNKDLVAYLPGASAAAGAGDMGPKGGCDGTAPPNHSIVVSIGRVKTDNRITNTVVVEIELCNISHINLDPLLFHTIFNLIHPHADQMLWQYANTPFSPSKSYTYHDLCSNSDQLEKLRLVYGQYLSVHGPGGDGYNNYTTPGSTNVSSGSTTASLSDYSNSALQNDYTYTAKRQELGFDSLHDDGVDGSSGNGNGSGGGSGSSSHYGGNDVNESESTAEGVDGSTGDITAIAPVASSSMNDIDMDSSDGSSDTEQSDSTDQEELATHAVLLDQDGQIVVENHSDSDSDDDGNEDGDDDDDDGDDGDNDNNGDDDDNDHDDLPSQEEQLTASRNQRVHDHEPLNFDQYLLTEGGGSMGNSSNPADFIRGICILPPMTSLFLQYRLDPQVFHPEHLSLMYTQLFLHPHETPF